MRWGGGGGVEHLRFSIYLVCIESCLQLEEPNEHFDQEGEKGRLDLPSVCAALSRAELF